MMHCFHGTTQCQKSGAANKLLRKSDPRHEARLVHSENAPELWNVPGALRSHLESANQVGSDQVGRKEGLRRRE